MIHEMVHPSVIKLRGSGGGLIDALGRHSRPLSIDQLEPEMNVSRGSVTTAVTHLLEDGLIESARGDDGSPAYRLTRLGFRLALYRAKDRTEPTPAA